VRPIYSFDTSALICGIRDLFPLETFPSLWRHIEEEIDSGSVRCVDEVLRELERRDGDAVHAWALRQPNLMVELDSDIQQATKTVLQQHPKLLGLAKGRNGADPFVIALAVVHDGVVVTEEKPGSPTKPKIPDVCASMGLRSLTLVQFVVERGWTF